MVGAQKQADSEVQNITRAATAFSSLVTMPTTQSITINGREYFGLGLSPRDTADVAVNISANYEPMLNRMKEIATDAAQFCAMADIIYSHIRIKEDILAIPTEQMGDATKMMLIKALAQTWKNLQADVNAGNVDIVAKYGQIYGDYRVKLEAGDYAGIDAACTAAFGETRDVNIYKSVLSSRPVRQADSVSTVETPIDVAVEEPGAQSAPEGPLTWRLVKTPNQDGVTLQFINSNGSEEVQTPMRESFLSFLRIINDRNTNITAINPIPYTEQEISQMPADQQEAARNCPKLYELTYTVGSETRMRQIDLATMSALLATTGVSLETFNASEDKAATFKLAAQTVLDTQVMQMDDPNQRVEAPQKKSFWDKLKDWLMIILQILGVLTIVGRLGAMFGNDDIAKFANTTQTSFNDVVTTYYLADQAATGWKNVWLNLGDRTGQNNSGGSGTGGTTNINPGLTPKPKDETPDF